jgi:hypothetical protein
MKIWNSHPKVYLDVARTGEAKCPYCGTVYKLEHFGAGHFQRPKGLVIAPQWIGDAVMTEPLLRRLAARGERLTVGALPWVAPVYRAMPQVAEVIEFPFQHGGLQLKARRAIARQIEGPFDTAYVLPNSLKSALAAVAGRHAQARGLPGRGARGPADPPPEKPEEQAAHGGVLFRAEWRGRH